MKPTWLKLAFVVGSLIAGGAAEAADVSGYGERPSPYFYNYGPIYYPGPGPVVVGAPPIYRVLPPAYALPTQAIRRDNWLNPTRGPSCFAQPHWLWVEPLGYRRRNVVVCY